MSPTLTGRSGRLLSRALIVLGLMLSVAAPMLRFWVAPLLAQSPQVPGGAGFASYTSTGTITTLFDLEEAEAQLPSEAIRVTRTLTTRGDLAAAQEASAQGLNVAVADTVDRIVADDGRLIAELPFRLAADRRSQALVDCCSAKIGGV